ncbi:SRPBCC family protein [Terricaulis sp.]|uniref:SRPBCC family protein n=1 Tax=Terricaulis sp. TaxID=2768686 RepID=UPI002AC606C2|nr:SRPBCC family protein [Terricaulis sp.]MDZ4689824.1 SRPBCC family protein [Terricaulis sp.]
MSEQKHELVLELTMDAPAEKLFRCYSDPKLLQQWFAPKPWTIKSVDNDFRPGGRSSFVMASPEGQEYPNAGIYLEIVPNKKIVTTDAITPDTYEPAGPFMVAEITFEDLGNGKTKYRAVARHWTEETKTQHEQMGFHEGWGQTARQLETLAKTL